jgi:hypothetical protein
MTAPNPAKLRLETPTAVAAAAAAVNVSASGQEIVPTGPEAAVAAPLPTGPVPCGEADGRPRSALRSLVRALARQAAREQAAALISQQQAAATGAAGDA